MVSVLFSYKYNMLRFKQFLKEFAELPIIYAQKTANVKTDNGVKQVPYSELVKLNAISREKRNQNNTYIDDHRYKDDEGRLWLDVKHKDFDTIALAVLTGMYDTKRIKKDPATMTQDEFDSIIMDPVVNSKVNQIWTFLSDYMSKGTVTVYRGITLDNIIFDLVEKDPRIMRNINFILPYIDNTTKEFNSFSTSVFTAAGFAGALSYKSPLDAFRMDRNADRYNKDSMQIANRYFIDNLQDNTPQYAKLLISAEATPNNISFAFTAYILARHGGIKHSELNINNVSELKNPKIIYSNLSKFIK